MIIALVTGCSSPSVASIDEYAAWCQGRLDRVQERLEDNDGMQRWFEFVEWAEAHELASGGELTAAQEEFEDLFPEREALILGSMVVSGGVMIEEWESIIPPKELADLHSTMIVVLQVIGVDRFLAKSDEEIERVGEEMEASGLAHRAALEELKNNLTPGEYAKVVDAGCLLWDAPLTHAAQG